MAEKCIGMREDTGGQCNRSASSGSDFCYMHQSQEDDPTILHRGADVYHCPQDGTELLKKYKKNYHRCKSCKGVLLSAKGIEQKIVENISQLAEIESHQEVCPSCAEGANLSIRVVEYNYQQGGGIGGTGIGASTRYGVSNIWFCGDCWSIWVPSFRMSWNAPMMLSPVDVLFGYNMHEVREQQWPSYQMKLKEKRLEKEAMKEQRLTNRRAKWCNHMDDQGEQCRKNKSQKSTHDPEYCYKHQPK